MKRFRPRLGLLLLGASMLPGCVPVHAPLAADRDLPGSWGELSALGPDCRALEGTYLNEGTLAAADGPVRPLRLTSVLGITGDARTVSLRVRIRKTDSHGDAFVTLAVAPDEREGDPHELDSCFCIKQTLACTRIGEAYWSVPNLGLGGKQDNLYFALARDRSLVAKVQRYHADVILAVPLFGIEEPWARFVRTERR